MAAKSLTVPGLYRGKLGKKRSARAFDENEDPSAEISELHECVSLLFDHFSISRPCGLADELVWRQLALALAFQHVPCFQLERPRGRPKGASKWTKTNRTRLFADVVLRVRNGETESGACHNLVKLEPYKSLGIKPNSLLRRFKEIQIDPAFVSFLETILETVGEEHMDDALAVMQNRYGDFPA